MCGITGYFSNNKLVNGKDYLLRHELIKHRGPDDEGFFVKEASESFFSYGPDTIESLRNLKNIEDVNEASLIMGHRRLSILDLSKLGHQPYTHENFVMVYNGEVYNYVELRRELEELGISFESNCDTEVVLKSFFKWGKDAFNKFNGMWSIAIYNTLTNEMILSRDRFGIKPLYYFFEDETLIFSSELRFILPFLEKIDVCEEATYAYLRHCYSNHDDLTFFKGVKQLLPGHLLDFKKSNISITPFYELGTVQGTEPSLAKKSFEDSLNLRMRSDVGVGALLSGGIDSSAIVGKLDEMGKTGRLKTFSAVLSDESIDTEIEYIKETLEKVKVENHKVVVKPDLSRVEELIGVIEQPLRQFSEYGLFSIYENIKKNHDITVLLNGDGADEIFSGYREQSFCFLISLLMEGKLISFFKEFKALRERLSFAWSQLIVALLNTYLHNSNTVRKLNWNKYNVFKNKQFSEKPFYCDDYFRNKMMFDLRFSALREYLIYNDKTSMNFSLEARVPFLDHHLVETAYGLNKKELISKSITKKVLKDMIRGIIPNKVIDRKDKKGFYVPLEDWIRKDLKDEMDQEFLDIKENGLFSFLDHHEIYKTYQRYLKREHHDHSFIWRIYCLKVWKRAFNVRYS